jgi:hypothetical protein
MSDAVPPGHDPAPDAAHLQQLALERDLRVADLERTVEALQGERAALTEQVRQLRAHTGLEGAAREVKTRLKARAQSLRGSSGPAAPAVAPAMALAALPVAVGTPAPRWSPSIDIAGDARPGFFADPPTEVVWDLDVPAGCALRGLVALRPGAWEANAGGIDLTVQQRGADGETVASVVVAVDPSSRVADRRWVPWRLALAGEGRVRVVVRVAAAAGASADHAWAVVGDPRLEVPGLPPRVPAANGDGAAPRASGTAPTIALLLPVHDPDPGLLDRTLDAVVAQTSSAWELCICDDGSTDPAVRERLARAVAADPGRVRLVRHDAAQNISGATNAALTLAIAPFVATLDHDDVLAPDAIAAVGALLAAHPDTDVVYTDNDILAGASRRFSAALKPDWSPDLLRACMYTLHFSAYRRSLIDDVGGWRSAFDGAQDHDLVLRLSERTTRVRHLPRVLYHWRAHAGSAALGELAKPLAYERGRQAIEEHLGRTGQGDATVERLPQAGRYRVRYPRTQPVTVHLGLSTAPDDACVAAWRAALRDGDELLTAPGDASTFVDETRTHLFLEQPCVPAGGAETIDELAGLIEAGAVAAGGVVVDGDGRVVAGGVAFPQGLAVPLHPDASIDAGDRHPALTMVTNRLALRGVVALPAPTLQARSSTAPIDLIALTLAASAKGRVVWSPHAVFTADAERAALLATTSVDAILRTDRGARTDPFWNPLRWADRGDETVPESVHQNPLLDVVDP